MANEISVLFDMALRNGNVENNFSPGLVQVTQSSAKMLDKTVTVGTTEEAIDLGDISGAPLIALFNLDTTNYVEVGLTGSYPMRLVVNDPPTFFRYNGSSTIYLKANTAACEVRVVAYDA
jgi:hypothetical protein